VSDWPSVEELRGIAGWLGFHLDDGEAQLYRKVVLEQLGMLDHFMASLPQEERPAVRFPDRSIGTRPSLEENRYGAWLWRCRIGGKADGLLAGRTVSFKDHISVAGVPQSFASPLLDGFVPENDASVVSRVLDAGATVIGKNVMSGFMADFPRPINPHDRRHITGGSSSGSAVAVAAGDVDVSIGGDQGGSIRIPAAYCGVLGLKPTFGLVSHYGATFGADQSLDHVGPLARRVEDLAAVLEAVAGFDGSDPRQDRGVPEKLDVLHGLDGGVRGLRIGLLEEGFDQPIEPGVQAGVLAALEVLARAGAKVVRVSIPEHRAVDHAYRALAIEGARAVFDTGAQGAWAKTHYPGSTIAAVNGLWRAHADQLSPATKLYHLAAELSRRKYGGAVYAKAQNVRPAYVRAYDAALAEVDVLAMPTVREVAPLLDPPPEDPSAALESALRRHWMGAAVAYNTKPADYTGHPAIAVPCGKVGGLPISLQIIGRSFDEALLLRVAYAYQSSVDWDRQLTTEENPPS
jgi:amidase